MSNIFMVENEKAPIIKKILLESTFVKTEVIPFSSLPIGDYLIGLHIFERKTVNDFISSIFDNRHSKQGIKLQAARNDGFIIHYILEGDITETLKSRSISWNFFNKKRAEIEIGEKIPIIYTRDQVDTAYYLMTIAKLLSEISDDPIQIDIMKKSAKNEWSLSQKQAYLLMSIKGIGKKTAEAIVKEYNGDLMKFFQDVLNGEPKVVKNKIMKIIQEYLRGK